MHLTIHCKSCGYGWDIKIHPTEGIETKESWCPNCKSHHTITISIRNELTLFRSGK